MRKAYFFLQKHLHSVDFGDADIADGADFVRAEELDPASAFVEIELQGDNSCQLLGSIRFKVSIKKAVSLFLMQRYCFIRTCETTVKIWLMRRERKRNDQCSCASAHRIACRTTLKRSELDHFSTRLGSFAI